MPNWCDCTLNVSGVDADKFFEANSSPRERLSFSKSVPQPEDATTMVNLSAWGTKWDARSVHACVEPEKLQYKFITAWAPPVPWVFTVSKLYPLLTFHLKFEDYLNYRGQYKVTNGDVAVCEEAEYFREATREDAERVIEELGFLENLSTTQSVPELLRLRCNDLFTWSDSCEILANPDSLYTTVGSILKKHALARARDRLECLLWAIVVLNRFAKVVLERLHTPGGAGHEHTRKRFEEMTVNTKRQKTQ